MASELVNLVMSKIDTVVREARAKKYFGDAWANFWNDDYGVSLCKDRTERCFRKETGQSIYRYFRAKQYEEIFLMICDNEINPPKSVRQEFLGIERFRTKVEKFYGTDFDQILKDSREKIWASKNKDIEEIKQCLDEIYYIDEYEICDNGDVRMTFRDEAALLMISLNQPIIISSELNNQSLAQLEDENSKIVLLLSLEQAIKDGEDKFIQNGYSTSMSSEDLELGFMRLKSYNLASPQKIGDSVYYLHVYSDIEKKFLFDALSRNYDRFMPYFTVYQPNDVKIEKLEEFVNYHIGNLTFDLESLSNKAQKSKEYLINLVIDLIANGFLSIKPECLNPAC